MSDGHRTSTIARPRPSVEHGDQPTHVHDREPSITRSGLRGDFTRPIPVDKRLVQRRTNRFALGVFATLIVGALVASIFVLPIQSWLRQNKELGVRRGELSTIRSAVDEIQADVDRMNTNEGIREAAREEIDYVDAGEHRITVITVAPATQTLPSGWPYDQVTRIVELRRAAAAAASAAPSTTAAP